MSYHQTVNVLQGICQPAASPFDRSEWFALLADAGLSPLVALASEDDCCAALALTEIDGRIEPLRHWYSFTWRQMAPEGARGDALLASIARQLRERTHHVCLWPVPDEDGSATRLATAFRTAGWAVEMTPCDENHVLYVSGRSFDEYWGARPGALRSTLKRKEKLVRTEIYDCFDDVAWDAYDQIYAQSWKPDEDLPALLKQFAQQEGVEGRIRLGLAYSGDLPVAAQFWTVESGTAYIHKLAHLESHKQLSAGTTLSAALFRHAIDDDRVSTIDFGTGNDRYKADWMEHVRPRYRIDCLDPRQLSAWPALLKRRIRALAQPHRPG